MADPARPASLRFHRDRFPGRPAFDTAVSHAMLRRVAAGACPESLRLYRPENVMLFSSLDARRPGFPRAVEVAEQAGFGSAMRLAGGHAAAFLEESMAFAWAIRDVDARLHIRKRFEAVAGLVVEALKRLGLDARIGEVPGEYCPGEYSVNLAGRVKVMGVGQRVIRKGTHIGGVLTVAQSEKLRAGLIPVYAALGLEFRPESAGGIRDFDSSLGVDDVIDSMCAVFGSHGIEFDETRFDAATFDAAETLVPMHRVWQSEANDAESLHKTFAMATAANDGKTLLQTDRRVASGAPIVDAKK